MPIAITVPNSNNSAQAASGAAGLLNLVSGASQSNGVADQFKSLLAELGNNPQGASALTQQQISDLLTKEQTAGTATSGGTDLTQLEVKIKALLDADAATSTSATDGTDPSANLIAEIAALMQKFPALQQVFTGNIDTQQLQGISDALAKSSPNNPPDFSGLKLPSDLQSQLMAVAKDPAASAAFQDAAAQIIASPDLTAEVPAALENFAALVAQNPSASANAGLIPLNNNGLKATDVQAAINSAAQAANDKGNSGKSRPQGLLKPLDQGLPAQQPSNVSAPQNNNAADAGADASDLQSELQNNSNAAAAITDQTNAPTPVFAAAIVASTPTAAADQAAALQASKPALSITGVSDAYIAQQTTANQAATTANPAMQIAVQMQRNAQLNNNNFMMQLHPEELGRIQVEMKFDGNRVQTKITADKQETLDSLKQDSGSLTRALQNAGLQTDAGSLEFSLGGSQKQFTSQSQNNNASDNQFGTLLASNTADETSITPAGGSQWMTLGTGRVDVKL